MIIFKYEEPSEFQRKHYKILQLGFLGELYLMLKELEDFSKDGFYDASENIEKKDLDNNEINKKIMDSLPEEDIFEDCIEPEDYLKLKGTRDFFKEKMPPNLPILQQNFFTIW